MQTEYWPTYSQIIAARNEADLQTIMENEICIPADGASIFAKMDDAQIYSLAINSYHQSNIDAPRNMLEQELRDAVAQRMGDELGLLSETEYNMCELLASRGSVVLQRENARAAINLRRRLWCDAGSINGTPYAVMDYCTRELVLACSKREDLGKQRASIFSFNGTINSLLYQIGFLDAVIVRDYFMRTLLPGRKDDDAFDMANAFFSAQYDIRSVDGASVLVHPSVRDVSALIRDAKNGGGPEQEFTAEKTLCAMNALLPEEISAMRELKAHMHGLHPDEADELALDIRLLIKQNAPHGAVMSALYRRGCGINGNAGDAVMQLYESLPIWTLRGHSKSSIKISMVN